jgi:hypothetical protein
MASLKDISAKLLDLAIIMAITFKCRLYIFAKLFKFTALLS